MALWKKIRGTIGSIFQIGLGGPNLKNNAGVIEVRDSADAAYGIARVGSAVGNNDVLNLGFHESLDSFTHNLSETCYTELTRDGSNRVTDIITWATSAKALKVREVNLTRTSGRVSQIVCKQYNATGVLVQTLTHAITRSGGRVANIQTTRS